eukprot:g1601.t1
MVDMLSEELCAAIEEREELLDTLGIIDAIETGKGLSITHAPIDLNEEDAILPCLDNTTELSSTCTLRRVKVHGQKARSFSPTSPLDCCVPTEDVLSFEESVPVSIGSSNQTSKQQQPQERRIEEEEEEEDSAIYSEPLPTPRRLSSDPQMDTSEDVYVDMNNALSDSDDESATDEVHCNNADYSRATTVFTNQDSANSLEADETEDSSPKCWISNTAFASCVLHMLRPNEDEITNTETGTSVPNRSSHSLDRRDTRVSSSSSSRHTEFAKSSESGISMRSCDSELIERASVAHRLSLELKRMRFELQEKEMQVDFLAEKLLSCKHELKKEAAHRQRDVKALQEQLNEASASKFLLFCKLQTAEARVKESEELKTKERLSIMEEDQTATGSPNGVLKDRKCNVLLSNTVNLSLEAQKSIHKKRSSFSPEPSPSKVSESVGHHPLQETLSQTYKQLLQAEKRGDDLWQRVKELENQPRSGKKGATNSSPQSTNRTNTKPKIRASHNIKKVKMTQESSSLASGRVVRANLEHCARPESQPQQDRAARRVKASSKENKPLSKTSRWRS